MRSAIMVSRLCLRLCVFQNRNSQSSRNMKDSDGRIEKWKSYSSYQLFWRCEHSLHSFDLLEMYRHVRGKDEVDH